MTTRYEATPEDVAAAQPSAPAAAEAPADRPEWLPEKFNTPEDMAKAYAELEQKQGAASETPAGDEPATDDPAKGEEGAEGEADEQAARKEVEDRGLDFDAYNTEFQENGELSEDSYKALENAGIPKEMVDAYIAGQQALADTFTKAAFDAAGGEEGYKAMITWAAANLTEAQQAAYDKAVGGTVEEMMIAVRGLAAQYADANGKEGTMVNTGSNRASLDVYTSWDEVMKDMGTAEYKRGGAFNKQVQEKLARSNI